MLATYQPQQIERVAWLDTDFAYPQINVASIGKDASVETDGNEQRLMKEKSDMSQDILARWKTAIEQPRTTYLDPPVGHDMALETIKELEDLRAFKNAILKNPDFKELYYGECHGEPNARELIESVVFHMEDELCHALKVGHFEQYESDGGLDDAIAYNISSILRAANVMDENNEVSRHEPLNQS